MKCQVLKAIVLGALFYKAAWAAFAAGKTTQLRPSRPDELERTALPRYIFHPVQRGSSGSPDTSLSGNVKRLPSRPCGSMMASG